MKSTIQLIDDALKETNELKKIDSYLKNKSMDNVKKWMILSDYCFDDNKKVNNSITFTIMPYYSLCEVENLDLIIDKNFPKDIKSIKTANPAFLQLMTSGYFFHLSFLFKKDYYIYASSKQEEKKIIKDEFKRIYEEYRNIDDFDSFSKKLKILINDMNSNSFNLNLIKKTLLISHLAGYISYLISYYNQAEIIGYFSDRDKHLEYGDGIGLDLFSLNYQYICGINNINNIAKIVSHKVNSHETIWYESFNRIPDYITGTLASWDINHNIPIKKKFREVMENVLTVQDYNIILKLNLTQKSCERTVNIYNLSKNINIAL